MRTLIAIAAAVLAAATPAIADPAPSPIGLWSYADKDTGRQKALIRVDVREGELTGTVEQVFPAPGHPPDPICSKCDGALKDKPVRGLTIMWGLHQDGEAWTGGHIVDAETGSSYRVTVTPEADGAHLRVRGYLGFALLGRTEIWTRVN